MPPKSKSLEELVNGLSNQLEAISEQLKEVRDKQDDHETSLNNLKQLLQEAKSENAELKKVNSELKAEQVILKEKINGLEQRNRAHCIRVFDLPINGDSSDNDNVSTQLYQKLLLPILTYAKNNGHIKAIPPLQDTIEVAHILPGQKTHKPILCRFKQLAIKQTILHNKKEAAPRGPGRGDKPGPFLFPMFEDVTRDSYLLMKKLSADERVQASWFAGGSVRYRLTSSDTIRRVHHIFGPYEDLFN